MIPITSCQYSVMRTTSSRMTTNSTAPMTGPKNARTPPSSVTSTASPVWLQWEMTGVTALSSGASKAPARPA